MAIRNAGGAGALTVGDGILVVQVLDPARSAAGVFTLGGGPPSPVPYEYTLFHGGVDTDAANGNWYLRSTVILHGDPTLPECQIAAGPHAASAGGPELPRRNLALCGDPVDGAALRPQSARHAA